MKLAGLKKELDEKNKVTIPGEVPTTNQPLSDSPQEEKQFHYLVSSDEHEDETQEEVENTLGIVHVSRPSIKHVFFLLRPFLKPILEQFSKLDQELKELVKLLTMERIFLDSRASLSSSVSYEVNYRGRKFLFLYTSQPLTLGISGGGTLAAGANVWTPLAFPAGTQITASGVSDQNPVGVTIRACDIPIAQFVQVLGSGSISGQPLPSLPETEIGLWDGGSNIFVARSFTGDSASVANIMEVGLAGLSPAGNVDRWRSNYDNQTAFASGTIVVGSTTYGPFTNINATGVMLFLNITAIGTGTVILHVQGKDPVTNAVVDLLVDAFAITTNNGLYTFIVNVGSTPIVSTSGIAPGAGALRTVVSQQLPRTWQITAVVATANITASISYGYLL